MQILQDDRVVEPRQELRLHAVVEQVLLPEVVAQGEVLSDIDSSLVEHGLGRELDATRRRRDPTEHLIVQRFERSRAEEEHLPGFQVHHCLLTAVFRGQLVVDLLAFDQGQQRLLDVDPRDVRFAADHAGDLVDLIQADRGVLHVGPDLLRGRSRSEYAPGLLFETLEQPPRVHHALVAGERVGVEDHHDAVLLQLVVFFVEPLHRPHDRGLAGPRAADEHQIPERLALQMLEDRHRDEAQRFFLADHVPLDGLVDLDWSHSIPILCAPSEMDIIVWEKGTFHFLL